MRKIDHNKLNRLVSIIREALVGLEELSKIERQKFLQDKHLQASAKYHFIVAIEGAIDLASHIISRKKLRAPRDYADTFQVLGESGILEANFSEELKKMARFRNRLVHLYWEVDPQELRKILETRLGDLDTYITSIGEWLKKDE